MNEGNDAMSIGTIFWVLMIIWFIFGWIYENPQWGPYGRHGYHLLVFILLFLLGWHDFGFVIHG